MRLRVIGPIGDFSVAVEVWPAAGMESFQARRPLHRKNYGNRIMKLTIVIPALNEQDAIGSTIERTLAARDAIVQNSPVDDVEIIVVSDGSTDRTAEIAAGYDGIRLIIFEKNRGYGAAIKKGFEEGTGSVVGFLDADGTCDPNFFADLCRALTEDNAAVAIGSRMGPQSHMPGIRRFGNRVYALILSALSNRVITDSASGMRVIRRDALEQLYPLPDGLHFTPAMSARVLMDENLTIVERPMTYEERIGESKLHVFRDGIRFFRTILEMTMMWRPAKLLVAASVVCLMAMILFALHPIEMWLSAGHLQEDMIYRLLFCSFAGTVGLTLLSTGVVCERLRRFVNPLERPATFVWTVLDQCYSFPALLVVGIGVTPGLVWLVGPGCWTWVSAGFIESHWSRFVLAGLVTFGLFQQGLTTLTMNLLNFHAARKVWPTKSSIARPITFNASGVRSAAAPPYASSVGATPVRVA